MTRHTTINRREERPGCILRPPGGFMSCQQDNAPELKTQDKSHQATLVAHAPAAEESPCRTCRNFRCCPHRSERKKPARSMACYHCPCYSHPNHSVTARRTSHILLSRQPSPTANGCMRCNSWRYACPRFKKAFIWNTPSQS